MEKNETQLIKTQNNNQHSNQHINPNRQALSVNHRNLNNTSPNHHIHIHVHLPTPTRHVWKPHQYAQSDQHWKNNNTHHRPSYEGAGWKEMWREKKSPTTLRTETTQKDLRAGRNNQVNNVV